MPNTLLEAIENGLNQLKAQDVVTIDMRQKTSLTDHMLIASGTSSRHVCAIAEEVVSQAKDAGYRAMGCEGMESGEWVLIDFGDAVVHVMQSATRQHYDLERLWMGLETQRESHQNQQSFED